MATKGDASVGVKGAARANLSIKTPMSWAAVSRQRITLNARSSEVKPKSSHPPIKCLADAEDDEEEAVVAEVGQPHFDDLREIWENI
ncbi:MAG: hypothetical protein VX367_08670 [SAR324 cluster bacterium]|nr:hypothetical protein [SAR324 cluster bacterium]